MAPRQTRGAKKEENEFADLLRAGSETYKAGEAYESMNFDGVPAGTGYIARLSLVEWRKSKNDNVMLHREHVILEGEYAGRVVFDNMMFGLSDFGDGKIRQYLKLVTAEDLPDDPGELADIVAEIPEKYAYDCSMNIRRDSDFTNVDVVEVYDVDDKIDVDSLKPGSKPSKGKDKGKEVEKEEEPAEEDTKGKSKKGSAKKASEEDMLLERAQAFIESQDLAGELKKNKRKMEDIDDLKEEIGSWDYDEDDLSEDDVALLEELELSECIKPAEKKPAARGKR